MPSVGARGPGGSIVIGSVREGIPPRPTRSNFQEQENRSMLPEIDPKSVAADLKSGMIKEKVRQIYRFASIESLDHYISECIASGILSLSDVTPSPSVEKP